jgi:hypothetical protein
MCPDIMNEYNFILEYAFFIHFVTKRIGKIVICYIWLLIICKIFGAGLGIALCTMNVSLNLR